MSIRAAARKLRDHKWVIGPFTFGLRTARAVGIMKGARFYRHLPYRGVVTTQVPRGSSFRVIANGGAIENGLYWDGLFSHEPESMRTWLAYASGAHTVLDIGANSGIFALAACASGAVNVHAFEPMPRVLQILHENQIANQFKGLNVWPYAVGGEAGQATLYDPGGEAPTSASLSAEFAQNHFGDIPGASVEVITIDGFCAAHGIKQVDLIKLDVEGHEEHALLGMKDTILRWQPVILVEVLEEYEQRLRAVVQSLFGDMYVWQQIREGDGGLDRNVLLLPVVRDAKI